jgi:myo-inositol-1-phosphate synthase
MEGLGMKRIRVAVAGIGNCASSLVQGVEHYRALRPDDRAVGLLHTSIGGYLPSSIEFVAAFDVARAKVGKDLAEAIGAPPNNTLRFAEVPRLGVEVLRGRTHDGLGGYLASAIEESPAPAVDVARVLRDTRADVLVNYLPVGSQRAVEWYAEQALAAGCGFVNCMPVFIASNRLWARRFTDAGIPVIGDDVKSQVGATIVNRVLARLFEERGVRVERMSQLNVGGNMDFYNMLDRSRLESKKISKTGAVTSILGRDDLPADRIHIGPSDFVPWLDDRKWAYIRIEGRAFGGAPLTVELKLEVWDSPNSAGIVIDAIRCCKLALDRGLGGPIAEASGTFMKTPPVQWPDEEAARRLEAFIEGVPAGGAAAATAAAKLERGEAA